MKIHFVCAGNTYRSRLAEAYLSSLQLPNISVSSSGTIADENLNGPISWIAAWLMKKNSLVAYMSSHWTQTTPATLAAADKIIFMDESAYDTSKNNFNSQGSDYEVWEIRDLDANSKGDLGKMDTAAATFELIKTKVNDLISRLEVEK